MLVVIEMIEILMQTEEFLKGIFISCRIQAAKRNLLITQDVNDFLSNFLSVGRSRGNKPFDFGVNPDYNPDSGFLNKIFTTVVRASCKNFAGSAGQQRFAVCECF